MLNILSILLVLMSRQPDRTLSFRPLDPVEKQFIYHSLGSQEIAEERTRFQDGNSFIVYRFAFKKDTNAELTIRISAQYKVDLSSDGEHFDTVAASREGADATLRFDLTPYLRKGEFVYVQVGDAKPDDGWGGKIHEITIQGQILDKLVPQIGPFTPVFLKSRERLFATLPAPARHLYHFAARGASTEEIILFRTLQGLVNREKNQLLIADTWNIIPELLSHKWADKVTEIPDAATLFTLFPKRDVVVYDPNLHGSENLAVMIGSMEGLVVAHPDMVAKYHLIVKEDLRGRWKRTIDGYQAIYARYKDRFNKRTLVLCAPSKRPALYDYAMAHRTFTFWIVGGTDANKPGADRWAEEEWLETTLSRDFPVNIPILGYPQVEPADGIGENRGVALFSRCGKFLIPADHMTNMSLLSAYPNSRGKVRVAHPAPLVLDRSKVYASLVLSDGDNQCLWNGPTSFMFGYMRKMKADGPRNFCVSYTMGPSIVDLNPLAASLIADYLEPQDTIGGAVSGVGYMYMSHYANNFGTQRESVVHDFTALTADYLGYAGERWDWIMDYGGPGSPRLKDYIGLKGCAALMGGYGRETTDPAKTAEMVGPIAVFHSVSRMADADGVYADVKQVIDTGVRPLFLHVFIGNWGVNPEQMRSLAERLQKEGVVVVTPETLADLYHRKLEAKR